MLKTAQNIHEDAK